MEIKKFTPDFIHFIRQLNFINHLQRWLADRQNACEE